MEELVADDACDEEVDIAVVVVVGGRDAHPIAFAPYASCFGHVCEPAVSVITIEAIENNAGRICPSPAGALR